MALVPGVSTMWISRSISTGAAMVSTEAVDEHVWPLLGSVHQHVHARGGRRGALLQHPLADQRVDEGALAGIELADHDQQEQLVEAADRLGQRVLIGGLGPGARQRALQAAEALALVGEQRVVIRGEDARQSCS